MNFPLNSWFDTSNRISKHDRECVEDQILLYAYKDGIDMDSTEVKDTIAAMKLAIKEHNQKFPK